MIDIAQLATAAIAIISPHLPALAEKASESAAGEAGKALVTWLTSSFKGKPAEAALKNAIAEPENPLQLDILRAHIQDMATKDETFRTQLVEHLKAAGVTITQTADVKGDNNNVFQIAGSNNSVNTGS